MNNDHIKAHLNPTELVAFEIGQKKGHDDLLVEELVDCINRLCLELKNRDRRLFEYTRQPDPADFYSVGCTFCGAYWRPDEVPVHRFNCPVYKRTMGENFQ